MIQSINQTVNLVIKATSHLGIPQYGEIMIGDKGFEFYAERDISKFIQIPWEEVDYILVSVVFKGKWIPRYAIQTKKTGIFTFSSKEPKKVLRTVREYIEPNRIVKSLSFFEVIKRGVKNIFKKVNHQ